jgi:hypothetical protein
VRTFYASVWISKGEAKDRGVVPTGLVQGAQAVMSRQLLE